MSLCRFVLILALAFVEPAMTLAGGAGNSFVIRYVRVFDGVQVLPQHAVVVTNGIISAVVNEPQIPSGVPVIEGRGDTLLPGLFDSHVHIGNGEPALRQLLVFGVTTALDMFSDPAIDARIRNAEASGEDSDLAISAPLAF
jgi:imidazolonepropionase-like amidohydrolase